MAVAGAGNSTSLAGDIPNMGDQTFKVGKLSVEQRKEKIHRYMKKRNERNFSKKIKVLIHSFSHSSSSSPPCYKCDMHVRNHFPTICLCVYFLHYIRHA